MAPSVIGESIKGANLVAEVFENHLGFPCNPPPGSLRTDIVQAIQLGSRDKVFIVHSLIRATNESRTNVFKFVCFITHFLQLLSSSPFVNRCKRKVLWALL